MLTTLRWAVLGTLVTILGCEPAQPLPSDPQMVDAPDAGASKKSSKTDNRVTGEPSAGSRETPMETVDGGEGIEFIEAGAPTSPTPTVPTPTRTFPRAAKTGECEQGDGLYCDGDGVDGTQGFLYRCTGSTVKEDHRCKTACLSFGGAKDACDGEVSRCPSLDGPYCGENGVSGDPKTLYQCTKGVVTVKQKCPTSCVREAALTPDRCN